MSPVSRSIAKLPINLASQPFRRERAQNAAVALVCAALVCSLLVLIGLIYNGRAQASDLRKSIAAERRTLQLTQRDMLSSSNVLGRPENADVFARSVFLNELIARRAVSWNRVFRDLATVLPSNMRLEGIRLPQVPAEDTNGINHVQLDMVLGTDRPETIVDLLKRLQGSKLFGAAQMLGQQPPTQNDPLYKFRVTVAYDQKL